MVMIKLGGCAIVAGGLWLGATPAVAADPCMAPLPEVKQMMQRTALDEVTRDKIDTLLQDAAGLCEDGRADEAETKFANVRELIEAHAREHQSNAAD
jgi:hypothetical protein